MIERYRIDSVIAAGGFGITYLARHTTLGKVYAVKEHFPRQFSYREGATHSVRPTDQQTYAWSLGRFIEEGRALARCQHHGVMSVIDVFEGNGTAYMVLGHEDGKSLKAWLDGLGRTPTQAELDRIMAPLLDALDYVHGQGLLHRDLAPDNIMIRRDGSPCLIDFGAARQAVAERSQMMSAIVKGGFSPPEQYMRSGRAQGSWSDLYALGATLYRAVSGHVPPEATERQVDDEMLPVEKAISRPREFRRGFLAAIDRALLLDRTKRPQNVAEWRQELLGSSAATEPSRPAKSPGPGAPVGHREVAGNAGAPAVREVTFSELPRRPATNAGSGVTAPSRAPTPIVFFAAAALLAMAVWLAWGIWKPPRSAETPVPRISGQVAGSPKLILVAFNAAKCREFCTGDRDCRSWTWRGDNSCLIYNSPGVGENRR